METYLDSLGIRPDVQAFFAPYHQNLVFNYGRDQEILTGGYHKIPQTEAIWVAGEQTLATDILICSSAMDAICFLNLNYHLFNRPEQLLFVSTGISPSRNQFKNFEASRYHLIFAHDLLGHVCDLKVAGWLRKQPVRIESMASSKLKLNFRSKEYLFDQQIFTLNRFERKTKYRFHIATHKPKYQNTFFEQTKHGYQP
jgi:hypothetical protein